MLTFTEKCLNITMTNGCKHYKSITDDGVVHVLETVKISDVRVANAESTPSYSQTNVPYSFLKGRKAEVVTIDGVLCQANPTAISALLATLHGRNLPTLYNVFLPCSVLICTNNENHTEIPVGSQWMVQTFSISRTATRRGVILFNLKLMRYYQEIT